MGERKVLNVCTMAVVRFDMRAHGSCRRPCQHKYLVSIDVAVAYSFAYNALMCLHSKFGLQSLRSRVYHFPLAEILPSGL